MVLQTHGHLSATATETMLLRPAALDAKTSTVKERRTPERAQTASAVVCTCGAECGTWLRTGTWPGGACPALSDYGTDAGVLLPLQAAGSPPPAWRGIQLWVLRRTAVGFVASAVAPPVQPGSSGLWTLNA